MLGPDGKGLQGRRSGTAAARGFGEYLNGSGARPVGRPFGPAGQRAHDGGPWRLANRRGSATIGAHVASGREKGNGGRP